MRATPTRRLLIKLAALMMLTIFASSPNVACGDDLVTLSGTTYHDVQAVRVEPDGVTWQYDEGIAKVAFSDSPESVRKAYHYDVAKATAYHDAEMQAQQQVQQRTREVLKENDARRAARAQATAAEAAARAPVDTDMTFRRAASPAASAGTRALGQQMEAAAAKKATAPTGAWGGLANSRVGHILSGLGLVNFYSGPSRLNAPDAEVGSGATKRGLQQEASASSSSYYTHDVPEYSTKSYYDDVDRSDALLRGVPLRP